MLHANASFASVRALVRLNTGEFLNALRLNDEIRRGVPRTFPACSTKVCFGTSQSAFFRSNYHRTIYPYCLFVVSFDDIIVWEYSVPVDFAAVSEKAMHMENRHNTENVGNGGNPAEISEQMLLDAFLCEIVVIDTGKRIVKANESYCMARGASLAQVVGMPIEACGNADAILKALEYPTETKLIF